VAPVVSSVSLCSASRPETKESSIAVDARVVPLGAPVYVVLRDAARPAWALRLVATGDFVVPGVRLGLKAGRVNIGSRAGQHDTIDRIEQTLDTLRPYIASHRGHVEVVDFDDEQ
jgi:hypothetical protein